jgi:hypothetical protein
MGKVVAGVIPVVGWLSLILQFALAMTNPVTPEPGFAERFIRFSPFRFAAESADAV